MPNYQSTSIRSVPRDVVPVVVNPELSRQSAVVMGGLFEIILVNGKQSSMDKAFNLLLDLENKWSRFIGGSQISQLNWAEGKPVNVSSETILLVRLMIQAWRDTDGAFDPTSLPATISNGYAVSHSDASRMTTLPASAIWPGDVGGIEIDDDQFTITLPRGTTLDPGGLGKGLAADLVADLVMAEGATGVLVNANGDVRVAGLAPGGQWWRIGVEHPYDATSEIGQIHIADGAVVTSSRVYKAWKSGEVSTHHLIDVRTGQSAQTNILTATVVCSTAAQGEVLAKLPFFMSVEDAIEHIVRAGAQVCIVDSDLITYTSSGWQNQN